MARDDEAKARLIGRKQAEWATQDERDQNEAIAALLNTYIGRRCLWWLLQIGRVGTQPFDKDDRVTAFQCGELNVGQQVLARMMEVDPTGFVKMQQENANVHTEREHQLDALLDEPRTGGGDNEGGGDTDPSGQSDNS